jgi:hypothetical protein
VISPMTRDPSMKLMANSLWNEIANPSDDTVPLGSGELASQVFSLKKQSSNHSCFGPCWLCIPYVLFRISDCNCRRTVVCKNTALYEHGSPCRGPKWPAWMSTSCRGDGCCLVSWSARIGVSEGTHRNIDEPIRYTRWPA